MDTITAEAKQIVSELRGARRQGRPRPRPDGDRRQGERRRRSRASTGRCTRWRTAGACAAAPSSPTRRPARAAQEWSESADAPPRRHPQDPAARLGADRDRAGGRVRLLRRAGLQGAAGGGLRGRARQLEPGDDHDRPRVRRPHLRRAAAAGPGRQGDRARAARRAAADPGRPDGAEPRQGAARRRHAGALRRRADRRRLRGDPPRRGPRGLPRDDGGGRPAGSVVADRDLGRRGREGPRRRRDHPAGDRPARLHARRPRRRSGAHRDRDGPGRLRGPRRQPDRPGAGRGVRDRLGRVRARGDARPQRQRGHHLLDRERGPDGGPHRRLGHGRAGADADRSPSTRSCATRRSR